MTERVRAAVVTAPGGRPTIETVDLDDLRADEVLVRVAATGICHTDVAWASGDLGPDLFPAVLGHETAGTVEAVGSGVGRVRPGDRVVLALTHNCGHCFACESGTPMLCTKRIQREGRIRLDGTEVIQGFGTAGLAEASIVPEVSAIRIPDGVPMDVAALAGCAVATGIGAAVNIAQVQPGSTVAVLGCGGIGMSILMGARVSGAELIVAADPNPDRRARAELFGATDTVESDADALRAFAPEGFDYVFEAVGRTEVMEMAVPLARRGGTVVLIGVPARGATASFDAFDLVTAQRRILGCLTGNLRPNIDFDAYFRLWRRGLLPLDELTSATIPLEQVAEGFAASDRGDGLRTVVTMA